MDKQALLRKLPSVSEVLALDDMQPAIESFGRELTTDAVRTVIDGKRADILAGETVEETMSTYVSEVEEQLGEKVAPTLQPVINATGVIVHTNLGRAPLSEATQVAIAQTAAYYSTLEFDLGNGKRGSRSVHANKLVQQLTNAEDSIVVNNTASGVMLMLNALCVGKEVIISRGQLVEIGGGFRVPDVMAQSGAILREVGTTNRTHVRDYENAINENTAAILVAHHSNYKIVGFTTEPSLKELAELAQKHNILLLFDQGSGALYDTADYGLAPEPLVQDAVADGCDVVAFSGDKLLGGPQAGLLVGKTEAIQKCKNHPLARAVRADKLCLAGLAATLAHYVRDEAKSAVPIWRMMAVSLEELEETAVKWLADLRDSTLDFTVTDGFSTVGGGSVPGSKLPTKLLSLTHDHPDAIAKQLRELETPIIGRIHEGQLHFDPRTILDADQEKELLAGLRSL